MLFVCVQGGTLIGSVKHHCYSKLVDKCWGEASFNVKKEVRMIRETFKEGSKWVWNEIIIKCAGGMASYLHYYIYFVWYLDYI